MLSRMLDWIIQKATGAKYWVLFRCYAKHVYGKSAPVDWRIREGIPDHNQWPKNLKSSNFVVGKVHCGKVRPVPAPAFPAGANRNWAKHPPIVCLCGSTRFYDAFQQANYDLTMRGKIVLSVGFYPHAKIEAGHGEGVGRDCAEKIALDELPKRKIDLADEVFVLNVGGYVGDSTRSEIKYAEATGKLVRYLEPEVQDAH